jgi:hypothetical protein
MKISAKILSIIVCAHLTTAASLYAQVFTFDEFGNSSGPGISPGIVQPDPSGGLPASTPVLVYNLSFPVTSGDLWLTNGYEGLSDVVRFWDPNPASGGSSQIIFYSDVSTTDPADSPADTGFPQNSLPILSITEAGPEGNNGAAYTPAGVGDPGFNLTGVAVTYRIISDVPEPNVLALAVLGGGLLLLLLKQRYPAGIN